MAILLENPTLLQSVLAFAPLEDAATTLAFVRFAAVLESPGEAVLEAARAREVARGEITGPQLSLRVAWPVADYATALGRSIDPKFERARALWTQFPSTHAGR
jgi:membrane-associated phospholipid phosphatase